MYLQPAAILRRTRKKLLPDLSLVWPYIKYKYLKVFVLKKLFLLLLNIRLLIANAQVLSKEMSRNLISQPYYFYTTLSYQEAANSM